MQINKIQSPNFGKVTIHKSAHKVLEQMPDSHITQMFEQAASIQKTQYWDLFVKGHEYPRQFYMYFINKQDEAETSFVEELLPYKLEGKTLHAIGTDAKLYMNLNNIYALEFANEKRAKEVYDFLNHPEPISHIDTFTRAVETIKILEEASTPKHRPETEKKPSLWDKFISFFK